MSGDVSSGVQDAPDIDAVVGGHIEDEIGEFLERPIPKLWDLQFKCESERTGEWMLLKVIDRGFYRFYKPKCRIWSGFFAVVGNRGLDVAGSLGAEVGLHSSDVGLGLVSE